MKLLLGRGGGEFELVCDRPTLALGSVLMMCLFIIIKMEFIYKDFFAAFIWAVKYPQGDLVKFPRLIYCGPGLLSHLL